ncbi:MAG: hypothetical protein HY296_06690 [Thaumarchaeota archaeon]|nr:hypothetical protein [Nitrososphaerota archaeon]
MSRAETPTGLLAEGIPVPCDLNVLNTSGPSFVSKAYDFPAGLNASGQAIVIVDAYGSPTIAADLAHFDTYFGLPAPLHSQLNAQLHQPDAPPLRPLGHTTRRTGGRDVA